MIRPRYVVLLLTMTAAYLVAGNQPDKPSETPPRPFARRDGPTLSAARAFATSDALRRMIRRATDQRASTAPPSASPPETLASARYRGIVLDAMTGQPVANARVTLIATRSNGSTTVSADTGVDGAFEVSEPGVSFDSLSLEITAPGYAKQRSIGAQLAPLRRAGARLLLERPATVHGRVLDRQGRAADAQTVTLRMLDGRPTGNRISTGDRGDYRLSGIAPGSYLLSADPMMFGDSPAVERVSLRASEQRQVDLVLGDHPKYWLRGRVVDRAGRPIYTAEIEIQPQRAPASDYQRVVLANAANSSTDLDGTFEIPVAEIGWYQVRVRPEWGGPDEVVGTAAIFTQASRGDGFDEHGWHDDSRTDDVAQPVQKVVASAPVVACRLRGSDGRQLGFSTFSISVRSGALMSSSGMGGSGYDGRVMNLLWPRSLGWMKISLSSREGTGSAMLRGPRDSCDLVAGRSS